MQFWFFLSPDEQAQAGEDNAEQVLNSLPVEGLDILFVQICCHICPIDVMLKTQLSILQTQLAAAWQILTAD